MIHVAFVCSIDVGVCIGPLHVHCETNTSLVEFSVLKYFVSCSTLNILKKASYISIAVHIRNIDPCQHIIWTMQLQMDGGSQVAFYSFWGLDDPHFALWSMMSHRALPLNGHVFLTTNIKQMMRNLQMMVFH